MQKSTPIRKLSRRQFLGTSTTAASAVAAPFILPSHIWAAETQPNDRITMAFIGMGKQNMSLLHNFLYRGVQVVGDRLPRRVLQPPALLPSITRNPVHRAFLMS